MSAACTVLLLGGCAKSPKDAVVGQWRDVKNSSTTTFSKDGRLAYETTTRVGNVRATGTYSVRADTLHSELTLLGQAPLVRSNRVRITGDRLYFLDAAGAPKDSLLRVIVD